MIKHRSDALQVTVGKCSCKSIIRQLGKPLIITSDSIEALLMTSDEAFFCCGDVLHITGSPLPSNVVVENYKWHNKKSVLL